MQSIQYNTIICRYTEIATKKGNRKFFENRMSDVIKKLLEKISDIRIFTVRGRIVIHKKSGFDKSEISFAVKRLQQYALGLESFSPAILCKPEMSEIENIVKITSPVIFDAHLKPGNEVSFRIRARRSNKKFPLISREIELRLAEIISGIYANKIDEVTGQSVIDKLNVNLTDADITVACEVREEFAFVYYDVYRAPGGLPVGSGAPVIALLSGGIDSPVACYLTMRRGCPVNFISFHSAPYTPPETEEKVIRLKDILNNFQPTVRGKLFLCNLSGFQKVVRDLCEERFRTILYRRMMFRIASTIAEKYRLKAIITGESIGQVASQTIENITTINAGVNDLILRPLITVDKHDTISIAKKIGTYDISKEQVPDSCTVFAPVNPATKTSIGRINFEETKIANYKELLEQLVADIKLID